MNIIKRMRELWTAQSQSDKKYICCMLAFFAIILLAIIIILCLTGDSFELIIYLKKD